MDIGVGQSRLQEPPELDTSGRVLIGWDPEDPARWDSRIAWKTLIVSTYSLFLGFCVWFMVSAIAPKLNEIGFDLSTAQLYWLTAMPGLSGGLLRLIFMVLPPILGTRKLIGFSSLLYIIPMVGWFFAVQDTTTSFGSLMMLSVLCGIGGGTFSGYMPSTGYFFPKRLSGTALALQSGIGNLGMSVIQIVGPWLMGFGLFGITFIAPMRGDQGSLWVFNAAIFFVPWAIVAVILAFVFLKDVPVKANIRQQLDIFGNANTWYMTLLYVMTFGIYSGLAAQFALIINNSFGRDSAFAQQGYSDLPTGLTYAFLGPLIGSLVRALWGPLCDKFGGAIWTFVSGVGMALSLTVCAVNLNPTDPGQFTPFLIGMLGFFFFAGIGNAGTFKQMPMIMPKRQAGGAIGFTAAIAAFGPFLVGMALANFNAQAFYIGCVFYCIACSVLCWVMYARKNAPFPG